MIISVLVLTTYAFAEIIHVPADQPTIQTGLMAATEGDTVLVAPNTYTENIFWPPTNGIKLMSENGPGNTIIDGSNTSTVIYMYGGTIDTTTVIDGFTLQNGTADAGGGIICVNVSLKLENLVIANNEGGGCDFTNSSAVVRDSEISNNNGIGIKCKENSNITVTGSIVENNNGSGIYFHSSTGNVSDCEITDNSASYKGGGMYCSESNPTLSNVTITGNSASKGGGMYCSESNPTLSNVTITGNSASYSGGGIYCEDNSSPSLENVTISNNSASDDGGGIWCISSSPSLVNVTIINNSASSKGGGIWCVSSSPSLENVTLSNNSASSGGGIYCRNNSSPSLENVTLSNNSAYYGGGMYCYQSNPTLENCTITVNSATNGGGMYCYDYSSPSLANVTISNNSATNGGGMYCYDYSSPSLANVTISNNSASSGGGMYCSSSSPTLENCTITENRAATEGDGIYTTNNSEPTVHYSNIMLNGYGILNNDQTVPDFDVTNNYWGSSSGPYHSYYNQSGQGDSLNTFVFNFIPYLTEADTTAPPIPPFGLDTLEVGEDFVTINWQNSPIGDLAGYKVYFNSDSTGFPYADTVLVGLDTTYTFFNLSAEDTIYAAITCYDNSGEESWYSKEVVVTTESIVSNSEGNFAAPKDFRLFQNYPNPFNPITTISYELPVSGFANLSVYNIKGELIEMLVNEYQSSGYQNIQWDASKVSSGIYFYKLTAGNKTVTKKMVLLK